MVPPINSDGIDCECSACWTSVFKCRDPDGVEPHPHFDAFTRVAKGNRLWSFNGDISEKDIPGLIRVLEKHMGQIGVGTIVKMDQARIGTQRGEIVEVSHEYGHWQYKVQYGPSVQGDWVRMKRGEFTIVEETD